MKTLAPLILASNSPRRKQLLRELDLTFEVLVRPAEEYFPDDMHPRAVAVLVAENKAKEYDDLSPDNIVITADTIVALEEQIMGKPRDFAEGLQMLQGLSGKTHQVITGVTLFHKGQFRSFSEETHVTFRKMKELEMRYYLEQYKPYDKAGAYGIQEWIGKVGITRIEGDYYNVMGLPTASLYAELSQYFV